jgi:NAD(P)-dependent dehydrogenase (short-subunit alcohol dehydrogenase family)
LTSVLFITGAGGALGRAVCLQFAQDGVKQISGLDISKKGLDETASILLQVFPGVVFHKIVADLTREEEVQRAIQETVLKFGRIDYAVNNAGIGQPLKPTSETNLADFDKVMAVNVKGLFLCEKYELLQMEKQEPRNLANSSSCVTSSPSGRSSLTIRECNTRPESKGAIVNVSSILGFLSMANLSLYNASKHGKLEFRA